MMKAALFGSLLGAALSDITVENVFFNDAEEAAVLAVANSGSFETLHHTFDIYDWKTNNIINGRHYQDLNQLAAVDGVTTFVLNLMKSEVNDICPPQSAQGGTYEGQTFTDAEADLTLKAANKGTFSSLRLVANIYETNAINIFKERQLCTMNELRHVSGVGYHVLRLLKKFINREQGACYVDADCSSTERCTGIPHDKILATGKCTPTASVTGEGNTCSTTVACPTGLVCSALSMGWANGFCRPEWMTGDFSTPYYLRYVDVASTPAVFPFFPVSGLATVPEDVVLSIDASEITNTQDLKIVLTDPNGASATYWDGSVQGSGAIPSTVNMLGEISRDDSVNGKWTISFVNTGSAAGTLRDLSLYLSSRWD